MSGTVSFGSNIFSLGAQRSLNKASNDVAKNLERLSTGLRINSASDDAAGLSIASKLMTDSRVYTQAIRNVNDAISLVNIAESTVSNYGTIVTRIQELAAQAANGTYSTTQRTSLNREANALIQEYNRLARSTDFNGIKVLDGTLTRFTTQLGYSTLSTNIGGNLQTTVGTGSFTDSGIAYTLPGGTSPQDITSGDFNGDGKIDFVTVGYTAGSGNTINVSLNNGDGSYTTTQFTGNDDGKGPISFKKISVADMNGDGKLDIVALGEEIQSSTAGTYQPVVQTFLGNGSGSFSYSASFTPLSGAVSSTYAGFMTVGDINGDGKSDVLMGYLDDFGTPGSMYMAFGNGSGGFSSSAFQAGGTLTQVESTGVLEDINGDGKADLITGAPGYTGVFVRLSTGSGFGAVTAYTAGASFAIGDVNGDGIKDIVSGLGTSEKVLIGSGNGTFTAGQTIAFAGNDGTVQKLVDVNGDGNLDIISANQIMLGDGSGSFTYASAHSASNALVAADFNGDGVPDIMSVNTSDTNAHLLTASTTTTPLLLSVDLTTVSGARSALTYFNNYQEQLSKEIGTLGAVQVRFSSAVNSLQENKLNYDAANSRIMDADIAQESANLVKNQILQQVASSVLAQANLLPQLGLKLLNG